MIVVLDASAAIEIVFQRKSADKLEKIIKESDPDNHDPCLDISESVL